MQITINPNFIEITPRVMRFKRGKPWYVSDEELEKIHQEYLTEKLDIIA